MKHQNTGNVKAFSCIKAVDAPVFFPLSQDMDQMPGFLFIPLPWVSKSRKKSGE